MIKKHPKTVFLSFVSLFFKIGLTVEVFAMALLVSQSFSLSTRKQKSVWEGMLRISAVLDVFVFRSGGVTQLLRAIES